MFTKFISMKYLIEFQKQYNLTPDGKLGPITATKIAEVLGIKSKEHLAHFLGQVHHETNGFKAGRESLNYTPKGLANFIKWSRITEMQALAYGKSNSKTADQVKIANIIYGGRWGKLNLGNTEPNDGWLFRGNGSIQLTGRFNHQQFADYVKDQSIMTNPDLILTKYYFESGKFFFDKNDVWRNCNSISDISITKVSKHINLGNPNHKGTPKHLIERIQLTNYYFNLIKNITL
jgi:putative chitinase